QTGDDLRQRQGRRARALPARVPARRLRRDDPRLALARVTRRPAPARPLTPARRGPAAGPACGAAAASGGRPGSATPTPAGPPETGAATAAPPPPSPRSSRTPR